MLADLAAVRRRLFDGVAGRIPREEWSERAGGGPSLNHLILHLARHQDLAVNTAIRNRRPLFAEHCAALGLGDQPPGSGLAEAEDTAITAALPADPLLAYAAAVFDQTAAWMERVGTMALDTVPDTPRRFGQLAELPADEFDWLYAMWTDQPVWWLVQWPVLGHGNNHVGEATGLRNRLGHSPF
jgi:hypothetical protein